jgi:hypothetical protein
VKKTQLMFDLVTSRDNFRRVDILRKYNCVLPNDHMYTRRSFDQGARLQIELVILDNFSS